MFKTISCISKYLKIFVLSTPLLIMQTLPSWGQALPTNSEVGFEIEGQSQLNQIVIPLFKYVGECPSSAIYATKVTAWFTSSTEPPSKGRRVIIRNISRGMSPDKFPFTDRDYSKGRASESTDIIFGTKHSNNIFVVRENTNDFEYEIRQDNSVVERGQFSAFVSSSSTIQEVPRNRREVDKGYCRVTALFCPNNQWVSKKVRVCPGEE